MVTAQAGDDGFNGVTRLAVEELPGIRQRPGFAGFLLLTDDTTGDVVTISLWQTLEDMKAVGNGTAEGIHDAAVPTTGLTSLRLQTYEVAVHA